MCPPCVYRPDTYSITEFFALALAGLALGSLVLALQGALAVVNLLPLDLVLDLVRVDAVLAATAAVRLQVDPLPMSMCWL